MRNNLSELRRLVVWHESLRSKCINLIASENVTSLSVRHFMISDLAHRYGAFEDGKFIKFYRGTRFISEITQMAERLAKRLFGTKYANVCPLSGNVADAALITGLVDPGETVVCLHIVHGGHFTGTDTVPTLHAKTEFFPFNTEELNIDIDKSILLLRRVRPKLILFGCSVFLFPHPVKEIAEVAKSIGTYVAYDASHVLGLIAGKQFQDPIKEGAGIMLGSTHKTFPGPQGGIILSDDEALFNKVSKALYPALVDNIHFNRVATLGAALAEMLRFGRKYAEQIVANARALAQALHERGINVVGKKLGFTASHTVLLDVSKQGGGDHVSDLLEKVNIITNPTFLPWTDLCKPQLNGIRIGTSEITRLGMRESDMENIADLIYRLLFKGEDKRKILADVIAFRKKFQKFHYSFDE